ncbi:MAG: nitroreductase family protein [Candidatus Acidiferrales bacterium]|jgi:nitroreductase
MEKRAQTSIPINEMLERRWSPRAFANRAVEPEKLRKLFEAARWSPSSSNNQPWFFIVSLKENPEEFARALDCLRPGNIAWAENAPVLLFTVARRSWPDKPDPNRHATYDLGQSVAHLTLEAMAEGLFVHQMGGFFPEKVKETYGIPDGFDVMTAVAIGYGGDADSLPDDLHKREIASRTRKPLESFVFAGHWETPAPLLRN